MWRSLWRSEDWGSLSNLAATRTSEGEKRRRGEEMTADSRKMADCKSATRAAPSVVLACRDGGRGAPPIHGVFGGADLQSADWGNKKTMEMKKHQLTEQQLAFMEIFGYLSFSGLLEDRIGEIIEAYDTVWAERGGGHDGKRHDGKSRSCIVPFIDQNEYLSSLLDDPRVDGIFSSLLGDDYQYLGSDGNYYVGDTGWHSDGGWPRPIIYYKMAFYLDPLTRESGSIRVVPGSHRYGEGYAEEVERQIRKSEDHWGIGGGEVPAMALETDPGDVVIFNQGTKHSTWGGGDWRRMFTINCTLRHTEEQLPLMREEVSHCARFLVDSIYGEAMLRSAGSDRMRHLEQALANQDHLPELSRQEREKRSEPSRG